MGRLENIRYVSSTRLLTITLFALILLYQAGELLKPQIEKATPFYGWFITVILHTIGLAMITWILTAYLKKSRIITDEEEEKWERYEFLVLFTISIWMNNLITWGII